MKRPAPQEDVESDGSESESSASAESTPQKRPRADADSATPAVDYSSASRGGDKRFAAPTHEELAELNTDRLYKSTLLAMQIRELVESQSIAYERHGLLEDTLVALRDALMSVREDKKERQVRANDVLAPGDIRVPMPSCDAEGDASEFAWRMQRPSAVHVVGSFMLRTVCAHQRNVDVLVEMPSSLFQDKDHLNHRYHRKRAYFLAELARHLHRKHATSLGHKMSFGASAYDGDVARPVLLLHQPRDQKSGRTVPFLVRIGVCAPVDTVFKASRLGPARNGVRTQAPVEPATPLYNAGLLADALWKRHMEVAHATLHDCESAREAVLLLKVWLRQRRIATDSLNGFTLTMLLVHLLRSRRVSALMSSYQLFRVVLETLAGDLLLTAAPSMCPDTPETTEETRNTANPLPSRAEFKRAFPVILIDPTGRINLLAHLTATAFDNVRHEARMSTEVLDAPASTVSVDAYTALFATPLTTAAKADYSLWLTRLPPVAASLVPLVSPAATVERPFDWPVHVANTIASLLRRAFTDRARVVYVEPRAPQVWSLTDAPTLPTVRAARVNVVLHPTASRRQLDRAPPSTVLEDQEREHTSHTQTPFRLLWASKVQLHQFSDGTLGDAVLWEMTASTRHLVVHRMATFLLTHHLGIAPSRVASTVDAYDTLLRAPHPTTTATSDGTANDLALLNDTLAPTAFSHAVRALEDLEKLLRNMGSSLPLRVASLQGASPHLSHTAVFPPPVYDVASFSSLSTSARYAPAISLVLRFESSSRWPDKVAAIERIKAAFLVRIASELDARHGIKAHVRAPPSSDDDDDADAEDAFGADHPDPSHAPTLDICYRGLLFRVAIHHPRELLLRRAGCELTPAIMLRLAQLDTPDAASATSATAGVYVSALRPDAPDGGAAVAAAVAASAPMRAQHVRTLATRVVFRPAHTTLIYSLSTRFPAFSGAVRLAKRWISAQMLSPYFTGEALELLVAAVFVSPWPYAVPATASAAFLRFLDLLTSHDWAAEPLVVNIDAALTPEAHAHASLAFSKAARDTLPALVLITAQDPTGCRWTHPHPSPTVLRRTLDLAVAAVDSLAAAQSSDHIRRVFIAPLAEYDALLSLRPDILPRAHQAILPHSAASTSTATTSTTTIAPTAKGATDSFKNLSSGLAGPPLPLYDHNVASVILNQLQCMFGEFAMFFYDACGGGHVGVAWREPAMAQHPFKVSRARYMRSALRSSEDRSSSSSKASSKTITVVPNLDHLLAAMREVARGCIQE